MQEATKIVLSKNGKIKQRNTTPKTKTKILEKFWRYVNRSGKTECWEWMGPIKRGYGVFMANYTLQRAHRFALEIKLRRKMRAGFYACHKCDNPKCCNPRHIYEGTAADNGRDMVERKRSKKGDAHHNARLTIEDVLSIRARPAIQEAILASEYGVTTTCIHFVRHHKTWKHV